LIARLAAHGPVTPKVPTSVHQLLRSDFWISETNAADIEPDWENLSQQWLSPSSPFDPLPNPAVRSLEGLHLPKGRILRFRLVANPSVKKTRRNENGQRRNSNRVPLVYEERQIAWLEEKGVLHGFAVRHALVSHPQNYTLWKRINKQKSAPPITLFTVRFDGVLQITDDEKFKEALLRGIGPAKAFGCGLLSLVSA
jgi:CRISPR system Cascade subunit CasE